MPRLADHFHSFRMLHGVLALFMASCLTARGADVAAEARVSREVTTLSEPVQYGIRIKGERSVENPPRITAEGMEIRYISSRASFSMPLQGPTESAVSLFYQVTGKQPGKFTIPSVEVQVNGRKYKTQPVGLTIQQNGGPADDQAPLQAQGIAELIVPKTTLFVGEIEPVDLKIYVDSRIHWQIADMPKIAAEGLSQQKMPEPRRLDDTVKRTDGRQYDVVTMHTAITPTKAGKILCGPTDIVYLAKIPLTRGEDASFSHLFDQGKLGDTLFSGTRKMKATAQPVELTVKELPVAGIPANFSGAVGNFEMAVDAGPKPARMSDPVTVKIKVSGQGNFDRVMAPVLADSAGWECHSLSGAFQAEDELGTRGVKTFEMSITPGTKITGEPSFEFSYFDPIEGKYVTRSGRPDNLR